MRPFSVNIEEAFAIHGVVETVDYIYVLLIDFGANTIIKRVKQDNTEIRFALKDDETSIEDFWANRELETYRYIYELKNL